MKKLTWLLIPLIGFFASSCGEDGSLANPVTLTEVVTSGVWKVQIYTESGQDFTGDFSGYTLTFNNNGTLAASCNGVNCSGTWSEDPVSRKISMNFTNTTPALDKINNQWQVAEINAAVINLSNLVPSEEFLGITRQ